jgi:hypothetical protein
MRIFNALNGAEVKQIILADIDKAMDGDQQFQKHLTYPQVEWTWKLTVKAYPSEPPQFGAEAAGEGTVKATEPEIVVLEGGRAVTKSDQNPDAQAPDDVRREAGVPVSMPTKTPGGWVDQPEKPESAFGAALQRRGRGGTTHAVPTP